MNLTTQQKWLLGGFSLAALFGLGLWWYSRREPQAALTTPEGCSVLESDTYRGVPFDIETCPGTEAAAYHFGVVKFANSPAERSPVGFASRDKAFDWIRTIVDQRLGGTAEPGTTTTGLGIPASPAVPQATFVG